MRQEQVAKTATLSKDPMEVVEEENETDMALCILLLKKRVHYLPVITVVFIIASFFISYGVSVVHGHEEADFTYISRTAVKSPERYIFAYLINIGAFLSAANVYLRYLQQTEMFKEHVHPFVDCCAKDRRLMIASLVIGWLSALGLSMVANFQVKDMRAPHNVGAGMAFGLGLVYCWIQTSISLRHPPIDCVTVLQLLNSIILSICLVTFGVSKTIFKVKEGRGEGTKHDELRPVYLVSTISEWLTAAAGVLFLLTFYPSFSKITITGPRIVLQRSRDPPRVRGSPILVGTRKNLPDATQHVPYSTANGNTHTTGMSNNGTPV